MSAPAAVLAAIEAVSGTVACLECWATVTVTYDAVLDCPVIRHPVRHAFGPAAAALADLVTDLMAGRVLIAAYGEPEPLHVWAATP